MVVAGQQFEFSATSPWGNDVTWSVDPPSSGTIDDAGHFTAAQVVPSSGVCTVIATLRSDPSRVGLAVVTIIARPPSGAATPDIVSATGGFQTGGGMQVQSIVQESFSATNSNNGTGTIEVRSGFFPSGSPGSP